MYFRTIQTFSYPNIFRPNCNDSKYCTVDRICNAKYEQRFENMSLHREKMRLFSDKTGVERKSQMTVRSGESQSHRADGAVPGSDEL